MALTIDTVRNDTTLTFTQGELLRGKNKGQLVMTPPKFTPENRTTIYAWIGEKELDNIVWARLRNLSNGWTDSAEDTEGTFQADAFKTYAESFSARGETMDELEAQIDELLSDMGTAAENGDSDKVLECGKAIKSLKAEIESKKRPRKNKEAVPA